TEPHCIPTGTEDTKQLSHLQTELETLKERLETAEELKNMLIKLDPNQLTPLEALNQLAAVKAHLQKK
ncbi:MAG: hypothetical protein K6F05_00120, partial [Succinivibrio sp.]|nr:hypothetical protein [Succinivibrio sp.]